MKHVETAVVKRESYDGFFKKYLALEICHLSLFRMLRSLSWKADSTKKRLDSHAAFRQELSAAQMKLEAQGSEQTERKLLSNLCAEMMYNLFAKLQSWTNIQNQIGTKLF